MKTFIPCCLIFVLTLGLKGALANALVSPPASTPDDATLKSIILSTATTLVYSSGPSDFNYTTSVSPGTASLTVTPTANDPNATVRVNGIVVPYHSQSASITLNGIVTTTINMQVVSQNLADTLTYAIVVYENGSNNAYLSGLTLSTGNSLVVSSSGTGTYNYTSSVSPSVNSLTITPTVSDPNATITVNGATVTSGSASAAINLNATGTTTVNTLVTAQDGVTTQTYSVIISKNGSNIGTLSSLSVSTNTAVTLVAGTNNYTTVVNPGVSSITVKPTPTDPTSTVQVNGTVVAGGASSGAIALNAPGPNGTNTTTIPVVVTSQDGSVVNSYTLTVSRNGTNIVTLSSVALSTGTKLTVSGSTYSTTVSPGTSSLTVTPTTTDPNATVTVNGIPVASGASSGAIAIASSGITTINMVVTSQDQTNTKSYTISVNPIGSNNASLTSKSLSTGTQLILTNQTSSGTTTTYNYTSSVVSGTSSLMITATTADPTATITVNGSTVSSGSPSQTITLNQGTSATTTFQMVVTAQDGVTKGIYNITVSNSGSNVSNINIMSVSGGSVLVSVPPVNGVTKYTTPEEKIKSIANRYVIF